jgi:molybdopterin converting factor subunit 1
MKISVKLFAVARQRAGASTVDVEVPAVATAGQLRRALAEQCPKLKDILPHSRIAVANEYADDSVPVSATVEVALIPPVSGG